MCAGLAGSVLETKLHNAVVDHAWCPQNANWTVEWVTLSAAARPDCLLSDLSIFYDPTSGRYGSGGPCSVSCRRM